MAEVGGLALGEPGLPGHRGVDALGDEGAAGIGRGHVHRVEVGLFQARLAKQDVQVELGHRAFIDRDLLAFQVSDRLDVLDRDDAVTAVGIVDRHDILEVGRFLQIEQRGIDRAGDHLDLVGHQGWEALLRVLHDDQIDIDAILLEHALVARDVERAVADPGGVGDLHGVFGARREADPGSAAEPGRAAAPPVAICVASSESPLVVSLRCWRGRGAYGTAGGAAICRYGLSLVSWLDLQL